MSTGDVMHQAAWAMACHGASAIGAAPPSGFFAARGPSAHDGAEELLAKMRLRHMQLLGAASPWMAPPQPHEEELLAKMRQHHVHLREGSCPAQQLQGAHQRQPERRSQERSSQAVTADTHALNEFRNDGSFLQQMMQLQKEQERVKSCEADVAEVEARGVLNLLEDASWLAKELAATEEAAGSGGTKDPTEPAVVLDLRKLWTPLWSALPEPAFGTQRFGMVYGWRDSAGLLHLDAAALCPEAFVWEPRSYSAVQNVAAAAVELQKEFEQCLRAFLAATFVSWAAEHKKLGEQAGIAWIVCNDGDAFSLAQPILEFGQTTVNSRDDGWRGTVLVVDSTKSSAQDPAVEVVALDACGDAAPKRLVFDICGTCDGA
eukprot:gnl/TRDRNA2_/TRDRNA2_55257_c0_seq1.p1 gnl/TRDRNA2_/TRDRNA2_55257_c0~~gnl/TRDRNA2_/TRDRNA2_55257_c0_seq1.p1  ORF type:complete len:375 (-),score=90.69 gnl/TRDRNA2_/TRDRNA2_55257_c0_seq1:19-1143(-)